MDLVLTRNRTCYDGVYGELCTPQGVRIAVTLEHTYLTDEGIITKIPPGEYLCKRGVHRLHHDSEPFETFEITGVEGHSGLLFHRGNFPHDSQGCVLLGEEVLHDMIARSAEAFRHFMELQAGESSFLLRVINQ